MANIDLASLGLTVDQLRDLVVERIANQVMSGVAIDEDGEQYVETSQFARKLNAKVREHIDAQMQAMAEKHLLPNVSEFVDKLVLKETNEWGQDKGKTWTIVEYLAEKCDKYMTEQVDWHGKDKAKAGHNFVGKCARLEWMVHEHLHHHIELAVKGWLADANKVLGKSIQETVKVKLAEVSAKLKVDVGVGR